MMVRNDSKARTDEQDAADDGRWNGAGDGVDLEPPVQQQLCVPADDLAVEAVGDACVPADGWYPGNSGG